MTTVRYRAPSQRSNSLYLDLDDNQPDYINMPKNYIKKITNRAEFSSPKGQEIKNTLLSEVLTIEKDFQNVERVKRNNQKLQAEFEAKQAELNLKSQQQQWIIEQTKIINQEKQLKEKREKNMRKQEDIQLRIQNVRRQEIQQRKQKMEEQKKKMDAFMRKKEENQANKTGPVYDNSQYLKSLEMKDRQIKQELDDCDRLKEQLDNKLRKGEINHQNHLGEIKQKFGKKQNDFSKYIEKQKLQEKELENKKIQSAAQTRHKQEFSAWLLKQEQEKKIQEKRKQDKFKAENIQHNLQRLQNEQEKKNAQLLNKLEQRTTKHARSQTQGSSSVKTLLELHLERKFKNDLNKKKQNQNLQQVIEQRQKESDYLQQKLQSSGEKKMIEEVRNKIRDYRLKARFQQSQGRYGSNFNQSVM